MNKLQLIDLAKEDDCLLAVSLRDDIKGVRLSGCFALWLDNVTMLSEMNKLQLIDLAKEDDCLLAVSLRDDIESVRLSGAGCFALGLDNVNKPKSEERSRTSLVRKSLDRDHGFFTSAGLLNTEELRMISKAKSRQPCFETRKDVKPDILKRTKLAINSRGLECGQVTMGNKSRKVGTCLSLSNRSQRVNLSSTLTNLTTPKTEKNLMICRLNESLSSSVSSKCSRWNISPKNIKPTSVPSYDLSPLSSICSSTTSPARSLCSTTSPTRSSIRKITGSGLQIPSDSLIR
ncbi:hypothetical protein Tco_0869131 [Tanacetum coccineum]